jgi:hypothetical protein
MNLSYAEYRVLDPESAREQLFLQLLYVCA